jgi:hypothetical protein
MQDATLLTEKRGWNGNNPKYDGVKPDQRIENEIGAQKAHPTMFWCWDNGSRGAIFRRESEGVRR